MGHMHANTAFDARMLVHFRLWRLKQRKTWLWQTLQNLLSSRLWNEMSIRLDVILHIVMFI